MPGPRKILGPAISPASPMISTYSGSDGAMRSICQPMIAPIPPIRVDMINERPATLVASLDACCPIEATLIMTGT